MNLKKDKCKLSELNNRKTCVCTCAHKREERERGSGKCDKKNEEILEVVRLRGEKERQTNKQRQIPRVQKH